MILITVGHLGRKEHGNLEGHITMSFPSLSLCIAWIYYYKPKFIIIIKNEQGVLFNLKLFKSLMDFKQVVLLIKSASSMLNAKYNHGINKVIDIFIPLSSFF